MSIEGDYHDQTALTVFDRNFQNYFYQTKFRCEKVVKRMPFGEGGRGKLERVNRRHSEGLMTAETGVFELIVPTSTSKHDARWVTTGYKHDVELVDESQMQEVLNDPMGELQKRQIERMNRTLDYDCVRAMFAPVKVGGTEATIENLTFAAGGGVTIDMTAGATYEKLLEIKETLIDREVINENDVNLYMSIDGGMNTSFLNELELTSGDYTATRNAETGEIQRALGIEFIRYGSASDVPDKILPVSGGIRTGFCATNDALRLYVQKEVHSVVEKDPNRHHTWRIITYMRYGFLRMSERHILKVTTTA